MTKEEKEKFAELEKLMKDIIYSNREFVVNNTKKIEALEEKIEEKHIPVSLEQEILKQVNSSIAKSITELLADPYHSPLFKMAEKIIKKYETELKKQMELIIQESITTNFDLEIKQAFKHKVARALVGALENETDKTINKLKNDPIFKSKLLLEVDKLVGEMNIKLK